MMGRMPSSYGRTVAVAVFVFVLTFSPYAHAADTSAFGINDPFADAIQLWSAVFSSIDSLAQRLASALQLHQTLTFTAKPHAPKNLQQPAALAASAALATQSPPETATTSGSASAASITSQQPQTTGPLEATFDQTTQSPFVKSPDFSPIVSASPQTLAAAPASASVNQQVLNAKLLEFDNTLAAEILAVSSANSTAIIGAYQAASYAVPPAAVTAVTDETFTGGTISSLAVTGTTTLSGVTLNQNWSTYGNGGKLTTDALGDIVCAADQGGAGSTVAGTDKQIQFNPTSPTEGVG
jgi:hypothetical protein